MPCRLRCGAVRYGTVRGLAIECDAREGYAGRPRTRQKRRLSESLMRSDTDGDANQWRGAGFEIDVIHC
jgi:hypothetical protein